MGGEELRRDAADGMPYTRAEFLAAYPTLAEWNASEEVRIDPADGKAYSEAEFIACYGGTDQWDAAAPGAAAADAAAGGGTAQSSRAAEPGVLDAAQSCGTLAGLADRQFDNVVLGEHVMRRVRRLGLRAAEVFEALQSAAQHGAAEPCTAAVAASSSGTVLSLKPPAATVADAAAGSAAAGQVLEVILVMPQDDDAGTLAGDSAVRVAYVRCAEGRPAPSAPLAAADWTGWTAHAERSLAADPRATLLGLCALCAADSARTRAVAEAHAEQYTKLTGQPAGPLWLRCLSAAAAERDGAGAERGAEGALAALPLLPRELADSPEAAALCVVQGRSFREAQAAVRRAQALADSSDQEPSARRPSVLSPLLLRALAVACARGAADGAAPTPGDAEFIDTLWRDTFAAAREGHRWAVPDHFARLVVCSWLGRDGIDMLEAADLRVAADGIPRGREDFAARGEDWGTAPEAEAEPLRLADGVPQPLAAFIARHGAEQGRQLWREAARTPGRIDRWVQYAAAGDLAVVGAAAGAYLALLAGDESRSAADRAARAAEFKAQCSARKIDPGAPCDDESAGEESEEGQEARAARAASRDEDSANLPMQSAADAIEGLMVRAAPAAFSALASRGAAGAAHEAKWT